MRYQLCRVALFALEAYADRWRIEVQYAEWESGDHTPELTSGAQEVAASGVRATLALMLEALNAPEDCLFTLNGERTQGPLDLMNRATNHVGSVTTRNERMNANDGFTAA